MKKHTILLAVATAMLCACGGGNQKSELDIIELTNFADDSCLARRIAKNVVLKDLDSASFNVVDWQQLPNTRPDNELTSFYTGKINDSISSVNIYCYNMHDGRYAVLYETEVALPWISFDNRTYLYDNNKLTPCDSIFPKPYINDFYSNYYKFPKPVQVLLSLQIDKQRYYLFNKDKSSVIVCFSNIKNHPYVQFGYYTGKVTYPGLEYKWTGSGFVPDTESEYHTIEGRDDWVSINEKAGVGNFAKFCGDSLFLYFGENQNYYISGSMGKKFPHMVAFAELTEGGKGAGFVLYRRSDDGRSYSLYQQNSCVGQFRFTNLALTHDGILQVSVADDGDKNKYTYYIKNISTTDEDNNQYESFELIGGKKGDKEILYPDGQSFDLYSFHFGEDVFDLCDMKAVWEQIEDDEDEASSHLEFGPNTVSYELGLYYMRTREIKSFPIGGGAFHVVDLYNFERWYDEHVESYAYGTKEYIFKDGKLTPVDVQPEIEKFSDRYNRYFVCDTLVAEMRLGFDSREKACLKWDPDAKKFRLLYHDHPSNANTESEGNADGNDEAFPETVSSFEKLNDYDDNISVKGDLNKDGIDDYAIGYGGTLAVYFGDGNGGGKRVAETSYEDLYTLSITDKGVLRVQTLYEFESSTILTYMFRYQDGDFFLIGGKDDWSEAEAISYNFLTNQKTVGKTTTTFPARPLKKLSEVSIGVFERGSKDNFLDD